MTIYILPETNTVCACPLSAMIQYLDLALKKTQSSLSDIIWHIKLYSSYITWTKGVCWALHSTSSPALLFKGRIHNKSKLMGM